jgi:hypothetical protein
VNPEDVERDLRERLEALGPAPRADRVLTLPDYDRAGRIGEFYGNPKTRGFAELLIDAEAEPALRACSPDAAGGGALRRTIGQRADTSQGVPEGPRRRSRGEQTRLVLASEGARSPTGRSAPSPGGGGEDAKDALVARGGDACCRNVRPGDGG